MEKSTAAQREEGILKFWEENKIFDKTLAKDSPKGDFIFYDGPVTANSKPVLHTMVPFAFKDVIPRYKTMCGYRVRRKGGWDTHGLPVELQIEKKLGFKSKSDIEKYGISAFNKLCKESVWEYIELWKSFTKRMGYWADQKHPYITYDKDFIESVWNIVKKIDNQKLLYKDYKVVPWCPRCGTGLSSHELAQGYQDDKDLTVYAKFKLKGQENTYVLAWTTTPWTLPANVALAVGEKIEYVKVKIKDSPDTYILAKNSLTKHFPLQEGTHAYVTEPIQNTDLIGLEYESLYPFVKSDFKIYSADFVNTSDGTGIVHIAPMYGTDDFELATKVGLPKRHLVNDDGTFKKEAGFLSGKFVKDEEVAVDIIKDLAARNLLFKKEKYEHSYPHCWRCKTALIYYARDSWYIRMSALRDTLVRENRSINWEPENIKDGRFGEWLKEVKDWAVSRERYWGTPLPVWSCDMCKKTEVVGSYEELKNKTSRGNTFLVMRHGECIHNVTNTLSTKPDAPHHLTLKGTEEVRLSAQKLKGKKIDLIIASPFVRTRETADIVALAIGCPKNKVVIDERIAEINAGGFDGRPIDEYHAYFKTEDEYFTKAPDGGENFNDIRKRVGSFLYDIDARNHDATILVVTHDTPIWLLFGASKGENITQLLATPVAEDFSKHAEVKELKFSALPHNEYYELDPHRPFIDAIECGCDCGGTMKRVKEVMDVWFDSGAMPFAQDHYPFENKKWVEGRGFPADYISEAIDQTRGWFYTLHAIGVLMGRGKAYKNVICLGHLLDAKGKKMSKSVGNIVDPWEQMDKYGVDALRFFMYSVNHPGDSKNYDETTVDEIVKKVFNPLSNIESFYLMYKEDVVNELNPYDSKSVLDQWLLALKDELAEAVTEKMEHYNLFDPARLIRDFIADFSQWYVRRSRDRFKDDGSEDKKWALATTRAVLLDIARLLAPFTPFTAENMYKNVGGALASVHLESWPSPKKRFFFLKNSKNKEILENMKNVRSLASQGLQIRAKEAIKVRQPLARVSIPLTGNETLCAREQYLELIKDELNVKNVAFDSGISEIKLDLVITSELKAEGDYRELLRAIQDMRKKKNFVQSDRAVLSIETDEAGRALVEHFKSDFMKVAGLDAIEFKVLGEDVEKMQIDSSVFKVYLTRG